MVGWTTAISNLFEAVISNIDPLESTKKGDETKAKMALDFGKPTTFPTFAFALFQKDGLSGTDRGGAPQQQERPNMSPFLGCRASASILLLPKEREVEREK